MEPYWSSPASWRDRLVSFLGAISHTSVSLEGTAPRAGNAIVVNCKLAGRFRLQIKGGPLDSDLGWVKGELKNGRYWVLKISSSVQEEAQTIEYLMIPRQTII